MSRRKSNIKIWQASRAQKINRAGLNLAAWTIAVRP
jgi:hypothetical protein